MIMLYQLLTTVALLAGMVAAGPCGGTSAKESGTAWAVRYNANGDFPLMASKRF